MALELVDLSVEMCGIPVEEEGGAKDGAKMGANIGFKDGAKVGAKLEDGVKEEEVFTVIF